MPRPHVRPRKWLTHLPAVRARTVHEKPLVVTAAIDLSGPKAGSWDGLRAEPALVPDDYGLLPTQTAAANSEYACRKE